MNKIMKKGISLSIVAVLAAQLAACGTILKPERKGQVSGELDTDIVVLDAIGLLFFLVPGVIAFAVDFNNGTIYLPNGSSSLEGGEQRVVQIEGGLTKDKIEQVVFEETGRDVDLDKSIVRSLEEDVKSSSLETQVKFL